MTFIPFDDGDAIIYFRSLIDSVVAEISNLEPEYVLKASSTELEEYYVSKLPIEPLVLHPDRQYIVDQRQTGVDVSHERNRFVPEGERAVVSGTRLEIAIPFEGDPRLWRLCPSERYDNLRFQPIEITDNNIVLRLLFPNDTAQSTIIRNNIKVTIARLGDMVGFLKRDVDNHNRWAPETIRRAIHEKIEEAKSVTDTIAGLGIPIRKRDQPLTYTLPMKRRPHPIKRPEVSTEPYRAEPTLGESEYAHILSIMRSMSSVIERNPGAFETLDEEGIRTHFLLQLNGHYEGGATGETFNAVGKTDILIREADRNCFIAECKFWKGAKVFDGAIDQLLNYLSWRDAKCALVVFNKNKDSSAVRAKMHEIMAGRPEHRKTVRHDPEGDSRYIYVKRSDPGKEIVITTQLYDVPNQAG